MIMILKSLGGVKVQRLGDLKWTLANSNGSIALNISSMPAYALEALQEQLGDPLFR